MKINSLSAEWFRYQRYSATGPGEGNTRLPERPGSSVDATGRYEPGSQRVTDGAGLGRSNQGQAALDRATEKQLERLGIIPCKTCQSRRYQDRSNDPGVSMKAPTYLSPAAAGVAVAAHENEHVQRERAQAEREGKEVIYQYVQFYYATCPECGRTYVAGGRTVTVTGPAEQDQKKAPGELVNLYA